MLSWLFSSAKTTSRKAATMTLPDAAQILDVVSAALQEDDGLPWHPVSSLRGYDVFQIDQALKLRAANDILVVAATGADESAFDEWVRSVGGIPISVATLFVPDTARDTLRRLPRDSREYFEAKFEMSPMPLDEKGFKDTRLASLETLTSFCKFCRHISASDRLYWQKVYTRVGLPYVEGAPEGNSPVWEVVAV